MSPKTKIEVVSICSESKKDKELQEKLEIHLSGLRREGIIDLWHSGKISPGQEWNVEISTRLKTADVILLLISADFMSSEDCYELGNEAVKRHKAREAIVIAILLKPTNSFDEDPLFVKIKRLPEDGRPVKKWRRHDDAFDSIATSLRRIILIKPNESLKGSLKLDNPVFFTDFVYERKESIFQKFKRYFWQFWWYLICFIPLVFIMNRCGLGLVSILSKISPDRGLLQQKGTEIHNELPDRAVEDYFFNLENGDYQAAWNKLSYEFKQQPLFSGDYSRYEYSWKKNFKRVRLQRVVIKGSQYLRAKLWVEWKYCSDKDKNFRLNANFWYLKRDKARRMWLIDEVEKSSIKDRKTEEKCSLD